LNPNGQSIKLLCNVLVRTRDISRSFIYTIVLILSACATAPAIIGIDNPSTPALSVEGVSRQRIFIATTRQNIEVVGALFSGLRARELGLASVDVTIPPNHEVGRIERPRSLPPDPNREFTIITPTVYPTDADFVASMNAEIVELDPGQQSAFFFVHGYNTTARSRATSTT
jgi:esterase/lipase superfamily enzyme